MKDRLTPVDYKKIIKQGKVWTDPYFKADINSIIDPGMGVNPGGSPNWETFVWKRPSDVYKDGKITVYDQIHPTDIKQGYCGDCYFLSSISSLAENASRVKDIFLTKEINSAGIYAMQLYINGEL